MLRIGLTGGIGSGKSTVARLFARLGVPIIDTDLIARELVEPGRPALERIAERLGSDLIGSDGRLDRNRLRARIFADRQARKDLEAILHPLILAEMQRRAQDSTHPYALLAIPLLVEKGWQRHVDRILVVDAPEELQLSRTAGRDRMNPEQVRAVLATQASREQRLATADDVILNDAAPADLEPQVTKLHRLYLRLSATETSPPRPH